VIGRFASGLPAVGPAGPRSINRAHSPLLAVGLPWLSVLAGSLLTLIPIATAIPLLPPLGFLMLLGWRLVRPGLLPVWAGFPLGAFDDLFSGQPFGCGILLWSLTMLGIEALEARFPWRGFWQDWAVAAFVIVAYLLSSALFSGSRLSPAMLYALAPQVIVSIVLFPLLARIVAGLDRIRLARVRVLG
jgi:rod shape-determining protein MreD